jgi:hypothetical protein
VQSIWYGISIRAGDPKPTPGSPRYIKHRRRIHIAVVTTYLLYTIYEADWELRRAGDFYQDLSIPHNASDRDIKSRFRRLAAIHHPDKVGPDAPDAQDYFVHLKLAQDILLDPAKRFAYDRFGPQIATWQHCSSIRDYLAQGLQSVLPYYVIGAIAMYILGLLGYLDWGKYWRWLTLAVLCVFELHTVSRPSFPPVASRFLNPLLSTLTSHPPYLPFQIMQLVRKISITIYIAFSQIGPLLQSPDAAAKQGDPETVLRNQLEKLENTAKAADMEASRLITLEMAPFMGDPAAMGDIRGKVKEFLVQNTIRNDPMVKDALGNVLKRRRVDAPAGARGNR